MLYSISLVIDDVIYLFYSFTVASSTLIGTFQQV